LLCLAVDTWFYGRLTFTPLNFLRVNVLEQISLFYGANPWHFYLSQGLPFDTLALLPFTLHGIYHLLRSSAGYANATRAVSVAIGTTFAFSLLSHKEFRFIQPLLPILHCASAHSLLRLGAGQRTSSSYKWLPNIKKSHVKLILGLNIPATLIFICIHMRGQVTVTDYIHSLPADELRSVGFLMPCHSTPWQSHLHRSSLESYRGESGYGGRLWALSCEPPLR
jgi:phosphatidylinositol glycan class B